MKLATLLVASAVFLASNAKAAASVTQTCKFEAGAMVIDYSEPKAATVLIHGEVRQ